MHVYHFGTVTVLLWLSLPHTLLLVLLNTTLLLYLTMVLLCICSMSLTIYYFSSCCLQERLRTLRASLGSSKAPLTDEGPAPHQRLPAPTPAHVRGARQKDPPRKRTGPHPAAAPSHSTALMMVPHSRKTTADPPEAAGIGPGAVTNDPESAGLDKNDGDSRHAGRLLECQAVQGLCQLLEHHLAVLEQSQQPLSDLLQPEAVPEGRHDHLSQTACGSQFRVVCQSSKPHSLGPMIGAQ